MSVIPKICAMHTQTFLLNSIGITPSVTLYYCIVYGDLQCVYQGETPFRGLDYRKMTNSDVKYFMQT